VAKSLFWVPDNTSRLAPDILAAEIVESLEAALEQFRGVEEALNAKD